MRGAVTAISLLAFCCTAPAQLADGLYAAFDTSMGGITCRLDYAEAPVTCANFAGLAEGTRNWIHPVTHAVHDSPFYQDLTFHRVITNFMIQGGCALGTGTSGPGYVFLDEFSTNLSHHSAGILSMANSGPDSNGSQFFITVTNTSWLNNKHSVFGEVVDGLDVVYAIGAVATGAGDAPLTDVTINQVGLLRIGTDARNFDAAAHPLPQVTALPVAITHAPEISTAYVTNHSFVTLYNSTNLHDWTTYQSEYLPAGATAWSETATTGSTREFFKGASIHYPQAIDVFSNVEGHTLTFSNAFNTLVFKPAGGGTGTCILNGNPDSIIFWSEWTSHPFLARIVFQTATYLNTAPLQFQIRPDGICTAYQWNGATGRWEYADQFIHINSPPL